MQDLDLIVDRLLSQRGAAIQFETFLRDLADNDSRWEKYKDSLSGHVINMQIVSVENSLILLCSRIWDENTDAQSIPNGIKMLGSFSTELLDRRKQDVDFSVYKNAEIKHRELERYVFELYNSLCAKRVRQVLRVLRTENLAHLVSESRDRARHFPEGFEAHGVTRYDLYDFARASVKLIENIIHLVSGSVLSYEDSAQHFRVFCEKYWNAMPVFRDSE